MKVTTDACLFGAWVSEELNGKVGANNSIVDIGTGTGLLSLMLAQKLSDCNIKAIEIDRDAAAQATKNFQDSPWSRRIELIHADARNYEKTHQSNLIISNPPFYEKELRSHDPGKNQAHHDDALVMEDLIAIIKNHLHPLGSFFVLLPYKRKLEITRLLQQEELCIQKELLVKPSPAKDYFRILIKGTHYNKIPCQTETLEMQIQNENGQYSDAFIALLKDYYLHL